MIPPEKLSLEQLNAVIAPHNSNNNGKLTYSNRHKPCPICGRTKDQDCRWNDQVVLCHTHTALDAGISGYVYRGAMHDGMWGLYFPQEASQKPIRPKSKQEFYYPAANGQNLVKVTRIDKGESSKSFFQSRAHGTGWVKGLTDEVKSQLHLYRITDAINQSAIANQNPILIVEGEGKVDLLLKMGIAATCSIGGARAWRRYGYPNYLEDLAGANVVLCPDRDQAGLKHCEDIALDFPDAKWLYAYPDSPLWERVPDKGGLDIADWISDGVTREEILGAIGEKRLQTQVLPEESTCFNDVKSNGQRRAKLAVKYEQVEAAIGNDLKLNTLTQTVELALVAKTIDQIQIELALKHNIDLSDNAATKIILTLAEKNRYSPACEYLKQVYARWGANDALLSSAAAFYLGTDKAFDALLLKRCLISIVARVMQPGCKVDTCLILKGEQGTLKSSFFQELLPEPSWFDDSLGKDVTNRDELAKLHLCVLMEWGEIEKAFYKKQAADIKHFLTQKIDRFRPAYRRDLLLFPRASVIVGTTNKEEFLTDETGDRRFWIVESKRVDILRLQAERDQLWAAATAAYTRGDCWWLTKEEEQIASQNNEQYRDTHPWQPVVEAYLEAAETTGEMVLATDILARIKPEKDKQTRNDLMEVAAVMRKLGWVKGDRVQVNNRRAYPWYKPSS